MKICKIRNGMADAVCWSIGQGPGTEIKDLDPELVPVGGPTVGPTDLEEKMFAIKMIRILKKK